MFQTTCIKGKITKNTELRGKLKTESPKSNGKIKSSNTSNEWITTVMFMTLYMHFLETLNINSK